MYTNIRIICEPKTYIKNNKIVQIIKPSVSNLYVSKDYKSVKGLSPEENYKKNFNDLISNVDMRFENMTHNINEISSNTFKKIEINRDLKINEIIK